MVGFVGCAPASLWADILPGMLVDTAGPLGYSCCGERPLGKPLGWPLRPVCCLCLSRLGLVCPLPGVVATTAYARLPMLGWMVCSSELYCLCQAGGMVGPSACARLLLWL